MRYFPVSLRHIRLCAKKNILLFIGFIFLSPCLLAQVIDELPTIETGNKKDKPIELKRLKIDVFVVENIATTTFEMDFYNQNDRVMEGELNFPLGNGITVSGFALDVNGELRKGVVVEKEKATQAYEAVTRRNVDPGIVEVTKGNNFKARVYPIPPKGYKKAVISFEQELSGDDKNYLYQLPLNIKHKLEKFSVKVEVVMNKPTPVTGNHPTINLNFTEARSSYISEYKEDNASLNTRVAFAIPKPQNVNRVLTYRGEVTSDNYFYINMNPVAESIPKPKPSRIAVVWDESASGNNRNIKKEFALLEAYLAWVKEGTVELKTFSNTLHTEKNFRIINGKASELFDYLKSLSYDGGTNLGAVDFSSINCEEILLFSDGIATFGEPQDYNLECPVIAINSSNIANHNLLEYFASASKGMYINAFGLSEQEISKLMQFQQKSLIRADYNSENITDFYPKPGQVITDTFSGAGKVEGAKSEITLHFGYGDRITESHTITIDNTNRLTNNIGERIWAQKKLNSLLVNGDHAEVIAHGKKFSLVTPGTSLIVLDEVSDYVNYEITPPASLQEEYNRLLAQKTKDNSVTKEQRLKAICERFKADINWWETENKPGPKDTGNTPPPPPQSEVIEVVEDQAELGMEDAALEEVVVTGYAANERARQNTQRSMENERRPAATIKVQKWDSKAPYMNDFKATDAKELYKKYLDLKSENAENPSFYFDVATYMFQKSQREEGLRVLSNLAELELENTELLRSLGRKLFEQKFYPEAITVFNEVMKLRSFEPHSYIDLGLTYAEMGEYQKAVDHLYTVIEKEWDSDIISRFPGIEIIVLHDMNKIIAQHQKQVNTTGIEECLLKHMPVDIRVVIDWDANETDIDLWITDPAGEKCSYQNKFTKIGGKMSNDIVQGYGPEEFRLKKAISGKYVIEANFYGTLKQTLLGNVTVRAIVYTNYGSKNEQQEILTLQLAPENKGEYTIGEMVF